MPYIHRDRRIDIDRFHNPWTMGELNYAITTMCNKFLADHEAPVPSYTDLNAVIGVLECVKLEYYRRVVAPYEDIKKTQNGDVYP